ncbi:endothelin-converting enzyme, putative [Ixodes scapularis]|uniref:Endothelin-converting enzyme, putative n=1 Tax=Ixodes scapularis TaxID=6945 RepID=B7PCT1_IXOSC|nr:endothelin-converting enzyme, putative [Ixodes scapularis]|eukprot:XP_002410243.1 endothelin-converting enzyme, putative [Ixodes scapularis]
MNRTISPCNDFVGYVCSRWKEVHPGISSPFKLVEEEVLSRAERDLLKAVVDPLQTLAVEKVTAAVQNCYAVSVSKAENLHVLNEFLANNGLQLPAGSDQAVPGPLELLVTLNLRLGIPLLLNLRPAIDLRTDDRMILTVMTDTDYLIQFNLEFSSNNTGAFKYVNGAAFARDVQNVQARYKTWLANVKAFGTTYLSVAQLANATPSISENNWLDAINLNLLKSISAETVIYVYESQGLYLVNKLVEEYKDNPRPAANWITMYLHYYFAGASSYRLPKLFIAYKDRQLAMKRLSDILVILGIARKFYSPVVMEKEYRYLPVFEGPFLQDLLQAFKNRAEVELSAFAHGTGKLERDASVFTELAQYGNAFYTPHLHTVYIPSVILTEPFVMLDSLVATYALLGTVLGHEISHAFSPKSVNLLATGIRRRWMTNRTWRDYSARLDCIIDLYHQPSFVRYARLTLDENYADVAGMEMAFAAMRSDPCVKPEAPSGIEGLNNMQLFFVAHCYMYCTSNNPRTYFYDGYAANYHRCINVIRLFREFMDAFRCVAPQNKQCVLL